jgi:hypothetical protein
MLPDLPFETHTCHCERGFLSESNRWKHGVSIYFEVHSEDAAEVSTCQLKARFFV